MNKALSTVVWIAIAALGAFAFAGIAFNREEPVSAAWLVTAAICVYLIAYRFYSKFLADKVLRLDDNRLTPAERHNDGLDYVYAPLGHTESIVPNVIATVLCVSGWGYFVYQGTVDPLGGVNTIWPLFGIGNQMLVGIALLLCTTVLMKMKRERYTWVTLVPTAWLLVCTLTAGWQKVFSTDPRIGFYALASKYSEAAAAGTVIAPAKTIEEMQRVAFNNYLCGTITGAFVTLVVVMAFFTIKMSLQALRSALPTAQEATYEGRGGVPEYATAH